MDEFEERLAYLEGRAEEQGRMVDVIRGAMLSLENRMAGVEGRMADLNSRMVSLEARMDRRFEHVEQRLETLHKMLWGLIIAVTSGALATAAGVITALVR